MKTNRFELKDFRLNEILSMLTTYNGPSESVRNFVSMG